MLYYAARLIRLVTNQKVPGVPNGLAEIADEARGVDLDSCFPAQGRPLDSLRRVERRVIHIKKRGRVRQVLVEWRGKLALKL
jgi:hypothetical protein